MRAMEVPRCCVVHDHPLASGSTAVSPTVKECSCTPDTSDPVRRPSPIRSSPEVATEAALARVTALEATISAEGSRRGSFEVKAKQSAHVPPAKADENLLKLQTERAQLAQSWQKGKPIRSVARGSRSGATNDSELRWMKLTRLVHVMWVSLSRAWKFFMLLPHDFLMAVVFALSREQWCHVDKRRREDDVQRRVDRAHASVQMGELSAVAMLWKGQQPSLLEQTQLDVHFPTQ